MKCRFCGKPLKYLFVSLGVSPLSNSYLNKEDLQKKEEFYPLTVYVCDKCFLVQLKEFEKPQKIFSEYAYFSSYSDTWLKHSQEYTRMVIDRFHLNQNSLVVELASNDGYLLQYFMERDIPVLGIEPAKNVAQVAKQKGIPTEIKFFGTHLAKELLKQGKSADLMVGNNVLAHVPDLNDFVAGLKILLKPDGVITMEFPHLMQLIDNIQFDTIYHEHFSYFSFLTVQKVFYHHGLEIFDVEEIGTHGGSLRIYGRHQENKKREITERVRCLQAREQKAGYQDIKFYLPFQEKVKSVKWNILSLLIRIKKAGKSIVGYGAPAKGNTLLNYCGIRTDFIDYAVDKNPYKQGRFLPGTHIPIEAPEKIRATKPDYVFILPWNIKEEIMEQADFIREWGGKFIIPLPNIEVR